MFGAGTKAPSPEVNAARGCAADSRSPAAAFVAQWCLKTAPSYPLAHSRSRGHLCGQRCGYLRHCMTEKWPNSGQRQDRNTPDIQCVLKTLVAHPNTYVSDGMLCTLLLLPGHRSAQRSFIVVALALLNEWHRILFLRIPISRGKRQDMGKYPLCPDVIPFAHDALSPDAASFSSIPPTIGHDVGHEREVLAHCVCGNDSRNGDPNRESCLPAYYGYASYH